MPTKLNLLPPERKQEIRKKKHLRLLLWQGFLLVGLLLFYSGILEGIHRGLILQVREAQTVADTENSQAFRELSEYEKTFQEINTRVLSLDTFQREHLSWSVMLGEVETALPEGVTLDGLLTKDYQVSLSGSAPDRDALLAFRDKLEQNDCFDKVIVPLSDLLSQKDIHFQLDAKIRPACLKPGNI